MPPQTPAKKRTRNDLSIPLAIVLAGVFVAGSILYTDKPTAAAPVAAAAVPSANPTGADTQDAPVDLLKLKSDDHVLGNPQADVVIIEYADAQCPFCQRYHQVMLQVMNDYGKTGSLAWVYRHFPLDQIHPYARKGAEALECANEQGGTVAFWKMEDKIFDPNTKSIAQSDLPALAATIGLDATKMATCLASGKYAARVERDFEEGVQVGVKGTPYTIIWNRKTGKQMAINGAYPYDNVKSILGIVTASAQNTTTDTGSN